MRGRVAVAAVVAGAVTAVVLVGVVSWADFVHWRSSGRRLGGHAQGARTAEAVVVLGYRNRGARANHVNRYRVRAALRSLDPGAVDSVLVLCGGRVGGEMSEAELMLRYARERRGYGGAVRLETESTTTWENVRNAIPLLEDRDTIKIVSNSLHAEKARAHLWQLRPDLAERLVRAQEHRFGEVAWVKPLAAIMGLRELARLARA